MGSSSIRTPVGPSTGVSRTDRSPKNGEEDDITVQVRYIVADVSASVAFYCDLLGFELEQQYGPAMAIVSQGDLRLWLAGPAASASKPMPDGRTPEPGGWNRIVMTVADLTETRSNLASKGVGFLNDILSGPGGRQCLCLDPSGNVVELFEPADSDG